MSATTEAVELAFTHHARGDLHAAEIASRQILQTDPLQVDALYLLGLIAFQAGHHANAVELVAAAVSRPPFDAHRLNTLGVVQMALGNTKEAIFAFRRGIEINERVPAFHNNLARALESAGDIPAAEAHLRRALALQPDYPEACLNLANIHKHKGEPQQAEALYRNALSARPDYANAAYNLGILFKDQGRLTEALDSLRLAVQFSPGFAMAHNNLGIVLRSLNQTGEAEECFRRALELDPNCMEAIANLGNIQDASGRTGEALSNYEKALSFAPDLAELHLNHAYTLLKSGNFRDGWREHEWRWKTGIFRSAWPDYTQTLWDGANLDGKRILLWYEQGLGDTLQFIRYAPLVAKKGGRVTVLCQPSLKSLVQSCRDIECVVADDEPLPEFDVHCPLMSLPLMLCTELSDIPADIPYLFPDPAHAAAWRDRLDACAKNAFKIGLVWAGNPRKDLPEANLVDARRSVRLNAFLPLLKTPSAVFFSLQKGETSVQVDEIPEPLRPLDFSGEWANFSDTAAFVANLDLVITVDTSVAHLTGALGRETWLLSRSDGCWRWLLERSDSPWYPALRIFRQTTPGNWAPVIEEVATSLQKKLENTTR